MIGNDVVDLGDPEARAEGLHPRFDRRVFTAAERRCIAFHGADGTWRWMLWAAKEAAYKVAVRRDPACVFAPRRFEAELDDAGVGRVRHAGADHPVRVTQHGDCIHAVATEPGRSLRGALTSVQATAGRDPGRAAAEASHEARAFALAGLTTHFGALPGALAIETRGRIPELVHRDGWQSALSLSHHGRYVAYACLRQAPEAAP